jgi:hypothetical protein
MKQVSNVQSFEKLLGICTGFGGAPGQQNLRAEKLSDLLNQVNIPYPAKNKLTIIHQITNHKSKNTNHQSIINH